MKRFQFILALSCGCLLACQQDLTRRERAVEGQLVEERFNNFVRFMNNAKVDSVLAFYHESPSLTIMWPDGRRAEGYPAAEQAWRDFYGSINYMNFVPQNPRFEVLSLDVALTTFRHSTDIVSVGGDRLPVTSGQGAIVWVRDQKGSEWKVHTEIHSVNSARLQ